MVLSNGSHLSHYLRSHTWDTSRLRCQQIIWYQVIKKICFSSQIFQSWRWVWQHGDQQTDLWSHSWRYRNKLLLCYRMCPLIGGDTRKQPRGTSGICSAQIQCDMCASDPERRLRFTGVTGSAGAKGRIPPPLLKKGGGSFLDVNNSKVVLQEGDASWITHECKQVCQKRTLWMETNILASERGPETGPWGTPQLNRR